ncbi:MAG: metal ABC transporter ATP-binding protein [Candidatus Sericytochromatia bacterium]|nr:metal ABC transporter ATP-binding protein [Candidatus Tanganyikabacteria bacterium]
MRVLEVRDLTVRLGGETLLDDVTFTVDRATILAVVGPNGAGKTTLFKALLGLVPYTGHVAWAPGARVVYVPQRFTVPAAMPLTVTEFFLLASPRFWLPDRQFVAHLTHELDLLGLPPHVLDRPVGVLSSGQLQRLLVSWALLEHPDVVLFDEPTASVDAGFGQTVYAIMRRICRERGATVLLISHDLNVVSTCADRVLCLNRRLLCTGPPAETLTPAALERLFGPVGVHGHAAGAGHAADRG